MLYRYLIGIHALLVSGSEVKRSQEMGLDPSRDP